MLNTPTPVLTSHLLFIFILLQFVGLVVEVGGGGSFIVLPLDNTGRVNHNIYKVRIQKYKFS